MTFAIKQKNVVRMSTKKRKKISYTLSDRLSVQQHIYNIPQ